MPHQNPSDDQLRKLLTDARTIAMVGASSSPDKPSHGIMKKMLAGGYRVIPVNPRESEVFGEPSYKALTDVPGHVDVVNVFRAPDAVPAIASEAVAIGAGSLWCQFTVINEEGARIAEAGGVNVIMDRCMKVEHARYIGRMHWLGFNTQRITSVRGGLQ